MKEWSYFDKFKNITAKYLPDYGEGENIATQTVTAVSKLVYKWYNDGDVFDNVRSPLVGWCNDLSSYANWLHEYKPQSIEVLERVFDCFTDSEYEDLLADLADMLLDEEKLKQDARIPKAGSVYNCEGPFRFDDTEDEEEEDLYW